MRYVAAQLAQGRQLAVGLDASAITRREAGAEVVDGDSHPELVQLLELGPGALAGMAFLDERGLGDLQAQEARRQPCGIERISPVASAMG